MTILEDELRLALRNRARALSVPERPALDRHVIEAHRRPGSRWMAAAACVALVAVGVVALAVRRADEADPVPPVATVDSDSTTPATTTPASSTPTTDRAVPVAPATTTASAPADVAPDQFVGVWVKIDSLGFVSTMTAEVAGDGSVEIVTTDFAWVCRGGPSTMTGTGRVQADGALVFPTPVLTCDDGSEPEDLTIAPLDEDLQNLTFTRDRVTDVLTDNLGAIWTREGTSSTIGPTSPPTEEAVTGLLNGFLDARLAGDGAQRYLNAPDDDIPLLYSTTAGARFDRAEFEPGRDLDWPYGFTPFTVRLFAGDTVVEQLFFVPEAGRLGLEFQADGFGTDIAATTEDGQPVAVSREFLDGEVTMRIAHPWMINGNFGRLIPEGPGLQPTTDGGERNDWDEFVLLADPEPVASEGCPSGASPTDAEALAETIRSNAGLETTAPVAVSVGGVESLMMDVTIAAGATGCVSEAFGGDLLDLVFYRTSSYNVGNGRATEESVRLYLFDAPEGSSMKTLAIAIVATESTFDRAVQAAAPVVASLEFHVP